MVGSHLPPPDEPNTGTHSSPLRRYPRTHSQSLPRKLSLAFAGRFGVMPLSDDRCVSGDFFTVLVCVPLYPDGRAPILVNAGLLPLSENVIQCWPAPSTVSSSATLFAPVILRSNSS